MSNEERELRVLCYSNCDPRHSLAPILISRFIINLRQSVPSEDDSELGTPSRPSTLRFNIPEHIVGNLGESLRVGGDDFEGDEDGILNREDDAGTQSVVGTGTVAERMDAYA